jgi:hypothetical protein
LLSDDDRRRLPACVDLGLDFLGGEEMNGSDQYSSRAFRGRTNETAVVTRH